MHRLNYRRAAGQWAGRGARQLQQRGRFRSCVCRQQQGWRRLSAWRAAAGRAQGGGPAGNQPHLRAQRPPQQARLAATNGSAVCHSSSSARRNARRLSCRLAALAAAEWSCVRQLCGMPLFVQPCAAVWHKYHCDRAQRGNRRVCAGAVHGGARGAALVASTARVQSHKDRRDQPLQHGPHQARNCCAQGTCLLICSDQDGAVL